MKKIAAIFIVALLLYGCVSGRSSLREPKFKLPSPSVSGPYSISKQWWSGFGSKILTKLVKYGLKNNPDIKIAYQKVKEAKSIYGISSANLLPSVSVSGSMGRFKASKSVNPFSKPSNDFSVEGLFSWNIDIFGRLSDLKKAALYEVEAEKEKARWMKLTLISAIIKSYFDLCSADFGVKIYKRIVSNDERLLKLFYRRYELGLSSKDDVRKIQIKLLSDRSMLNSFIRKQKLIKSDLLFLIGEQPVNIFEGSISTTVNIKPIPIPSFMPSRILEKRPDIRVALYQLKAAGYNLKAAKGSMLPSVNLTVEGGYESYQFRKWITPQSQLWNVFLNALIPLLEFGRISNQIKEYSFLRRQALLNYVKVVKRAFKDIYVDLNNLTILKRRMLYARQMRSDACFVYKDILAKYKNGLVGLSAVFDAENSCLSRNLDFVSIKFSYLKNEVELYKDLGGGW